MGTTRPNGSLYTNTVNGIAIVEFGHPAGNSFVSELLDRLHEALIVLSEDPQVKLIVLKSEGERAFCAGASLDELQSVTNLEEATAFFSGFAKVINAMRTNNKPVIGRVQGRAVGGGVGLIAACDYVFATEDAAVRLSEISIGIAPLVIAPAVERKIGVAGLAELSLAPSSWQNAFWAREKGLYAKVSGSMKEMDKELDIFTSQLATCPTAALQAMKKTLWEGTEHWDQLLFQRAEKSGRLSLTPETKEILARIKK